MSYTISKFGQSSLKPRDGEAGCLVLKNDGTCDAGNKIIRNVADPVDLGDAATKRFVLKANNDIITNVQGLMAEHEKLIQTYVSRLGLKMENVKDKITSDLTAMSEHVASVRREIIDRLNVVNALNKDHMREIEDSVSRKIDETVSRRADGV